MKSKHHGEFWKKMTPLLPSRGKNQSKIVFIDNERVITDSLVVADVSISIGSPHKLCR